MWCVGSERYNVQQRGSTYIVHTAREFVVGEEVKCRVLRAEIYHRCLLEGNGRHSKGSIHVVVGDGCVYIPGGTAVVAAAQSRQSTLPRYILCLNSTFYLPDLGTVGGTGSREQSDSMNDIEITQLLFYLVVDTCTVGIKSGKSPAVVPANCPHLSTLVTLLTDPLHKGQKSTHAPTLFIVPHPASVPEAFQVAEC